MAGAVAAHFHAHGRCDVDDARSSQDRIHSASGESAEFALRDEAADAVDEGEVGALEADEDGAVELGIDAKFGEDDIAAQADDAGDGGAHGFEDGSALAADAAAEDDDGWVHGGEEHAGAEGYRLDAFADGARGGAIAGGGGGEDRIRGGRCARGRGVAELDGAADDGRPAGAVLEVAFVAGGADGQEVDFASGEVRAAIDVAIEDDARADAGADGDEEGAFVAAGRAAPAFAHCGGVDIVFDDRGHAEDLLEHPADGDVAPPLRLRAVPTTPDSVSTMPGVARPMAMRSAPLAASSSRPTSPMRATIASGPDSGGSLRWCGRLWRRRGRRGRGAGACRRGPRPGRRRSRR